MIHRPLFPVLFVLLFLFLVLTAIASQTHVTSFEESPALLFKDVEEGSLLILDAGGSHVASWNEPLLARPLPPCSTFKIWNALFALETGVLKDGDTVIAWDGVRRARANWNMDHSLTTAIRESVVPYFQEVARRIGPQRMQEWLNRIGYGNADTSSGIDAFWLSGSLLISAEEQVALLRRFVNYDLPMARRNVDTVRRILCLESEGYPSVFGKTGSGTAPDGRNLGWYVGFVATPNGDAVFSVNVLDHNPVSGQTAKAIALAALRKYSLLPQTP